CGRERDARVLRGKIGQVLHLRRRRPVAPSAFRPAERALGDRQLHRGAASHLGIGGSLPIERSRFVERCALLHRNRRASGERRGEKGGGGPHWVSARSSSRNASMPRSTSAARRLARALSASTEASFASTWACSAKRLASSKSPRCMASS